MLVFLYKHQRMADIPIVGTAINRNLGLQCSWVMKYSLGTAPLSGWLLQRFGATGDPGGDPLTTPPAAPAYHTAFDRGAASGDPWDLTPANGAIASTDFFAMLIQFGHDCA